MTPALAARQTTTLLSKSDELWTATTDTTALIREVTQNFPNIMEEKLSMKLRELSKILESRSKRITEAEQQVSGGQDMVTGLEERFIKAERKMANGMDDMENWSRQDNTERGT